MESITPHHLKARLDQGDDIILIDVREPFEHEAFNIGGHLIPMADILQQTDLIDNQKEVVLYCAKGVRSQIAIQRLQEKFGYSNLINLQGGMDAWQKTFPYL